MFFCRLASLYEARRNVLKSEHCSLRKRQHYKLSSFSENRT